MGGERLTYNTASSRLESSDVPLYGDLGLGTSWFEELLRIAWL